MVDRTAQAFRLKDEPSLGELESGLTSGYRDYTPEDKQTEEAFKPRIDYMSLPAGANPDKDVVVGQTELGEPVYQTMMGTKYSLMTVTPEPKQWETEPQTMARAGEVLKSYATGAAEGIMNAPAEIWESMETLAGTSDRAATYGDVLNLAGLPATGAIPSIARGAIEGVDPNVATIFGGYTGKRTLEEDALGYSAARTKVRQEFVDAYKRFNVIRQELADEKQQQNLFVPEESINYEASQKLWEETGYFVGQDGMLRFEIDDSKAVITPTPLTSVKDFTEARSVISSGTTTTTLKDFLQHDDLYAAYPEIKDLPVFVDRSLAGTNTRGWFDPLAGQLSIALNPELLSNKWSIDNVALSTLLHEIQHYVQNKESFDEGINVDAPELVKIYDAEVSKKRGAEIWDNYEKQKAQFETTLEKTKSNAVSSVIDYYITMLSEDYGADAKKLSRAVFDYEGSNKTEEDKKEVRQAVEKAFSPSMFSFFSNNVAPLDLLQSFVDLIRYRDTESQDYLFNSTIKRLLKNNKEDFNSHFNFDNVDIKDIVDSFGRFKRDTVGYELFLPKDVQLPERPIFIDSSVPFGPDQIFDIYQRRSGETESRNVQERRKFTAEERARLFPRQTENVLPQFQWTGAEIVSKGYAEGGTVMPNTETQMNRLMQEGGIADDGMRRDPVSGNEIPPGSMASEVRDDIPAQLSEGEYVVPADVLRYYGVAFFEQLRAKAKRGLAEMEAGGRIGGEPVPMRNGMEMEDDLDDEDEMMLNEVMGMAQGGMMTSQPQQANNYYGLQPTMNIDRQTVRAFQEGGLNAAKPIDVNNPAASAAQFTSSFNPSKFRPGFMFDQGQQQPTQPAPQTEMRTYVNDRGEIRMIPFQNGQPLEPIPEGFYPQGQQPVKTQAQEGSGDQEQTENVDRAKEWAASNYERILTDPLSAAADTDVGMGGELIGSLIPGVSSLMKIDRIQQLEAISDLARSNGMVDEADTIKSQAETLKGELGIVGKGLYALVGKTNNYTSALQNQTTGAGRTGAVSGGGTVTPAATPAAAEASDRGTGAAAAPVGGRGTGATATTGRAVSPTTGQTVTSRGVTALEGPEATAPRKDYTTTTTGGTGGSTGFGRGNKGGLVGSSKSGLMQKPPSKKDTQKRKIKTTDA
jgi:hypothetical protein